VSVSDEHPLIAFAGRYSDPTIDYLNSYIAIARLDALLGDLDDVSQLIEFNNLGERRWHPWFGAEIISYYSVGFCTCLEWHAKSRLVDLLTFQPSALRISDVSRTITDKIIVQMVAQKASVTQLVGAALKISSLDGYIALIERIFEELKFPCSLIDWLTGTANGANVCWLRADHLASVERLFDFRHSLVHEIGIATMGHPNIRDSWSPEEARAIGKVVASLMYGVEAALTRYAPRLFPNLLTEERWPVGSTASLRDEFLRLDAIADRDVSTWEWDDNHTIGAWRLAREKFEDYLAAEEKFISTAGMLHWRYFDARTPLRTRLLKYRVDFLNDLLSHFSSATDDIDEGPPS